MDFCMRSSSTWQLIGYALFALKVLIPVVIIIYGVIDLVKALTASKDDAINSASKSILIRVIVGITIFFVPTIVRTVLRLVNDAVPYLNKAAACEECLLGPLGDKCKGSINEAKKQQEEAHKQQTQDGGYSGGVAVSGCYFCTNTFIWTNSPYSGCEKVYRDMYTDTIVDANMCSEFNSDPARAGFTNTAQIGAEDDEGGGVSGKPGKALNQEELKKAYEKMTTVPTYDDLYKFAKQNYNMSEDAFKVVFGWAVGEAYDRFKNSRGEIDYYLSYLTACVGLNRYMGLGITDATALAKSIQGAGPYSLYSVDAFKKKVSNAVNGGSYYDSTFKIMYLALKYPDENAHDCDGLSNYAPYGGVKYYIGGMYDGENIINVWSQWYEGYKHWVTGGD